MRIKPFFPTTSTRLQRELKAYKDKISYRFQRYHLLFSLDEKSKQTCLYSKTNPNIIIKKITPRVDEEGRKEFLFLQQQKL